MLSMIVTSWTHETRARVCVVPTTVYYRPRVLKVWYGEDPLKWTLDAVWGSCLRPDTSIAEINTWLHVIPDCRAGKIEIR